VSRLRTLWPALALLLITLVPVWRCVFGGETIGAWDEVRALGPWNVQDSKPWDVLQADSVLEFYGWRDQVFNAWSRWHLPLWNHYELNGTPLLANSQSGALYPPHILVGLLQIPTGPGMALLAWGHLFWAGLGVYLLCRRLGGGVRPALLGASGFALSPFMVAWVTLPSVVETVAWIPWALLGVYMLPARPGLPLLAVSVAMSLLAGHLQFAAYGLMAVFCALAVRAAQSKLSWKPIVGLGLVGLVTGALISGPQLLPVLNHGRNSHRANVPTSEGYAAYNAGALPAWELLSFPDSRLLGLPTSDLEIKGVTLNGFWPGLVQRGGNFAESAVGVGPVILLLVVAGLRRRTLASSLGVGVAGLVGILLAVGTPFGALLYFYAPGWSATGSPGRAAVLFVLALCVFAGSADFEADPLPTKAARDRLLIFFGLVVLATGLLFRLPFAPWLPTLTAEDLMTAVPHSALAAGVLGLAFAVALLGVLAFRIPKLRVPCGLGLAAALAVFPGAFLVRSSPKRLTPITTTAGRVAIVNGGWDLLQTPPALLPPNSATLIEVHVPGHYQVHEVGGYDSIVDKRTRDTLAEIDGEDPAPPANGNMMFVKRHFDPVKLADAGVTEVWSADQLSGLGQPLPSSSGFYRYRLPGPGRGSMSSGSPTWMSETAEWVEYEATGPGVFTLRDHLRDGWSARIDDQLTDFTRDPWPQVQVPAGRHTIRFQCWPRGLTTGFQTLALGLAIIAIYMVSSRRSHSGLANPVVQ